MIGTAFMPDAISALDTVIAVSVLIGLILVARRYVARHFGAGIAYALWALPVARLFLPPLQMPVSLMPLLHQTPAAGTTADHGTTMTITATVPAPPVPAFASAPPAPAVTASSPLHEAMPAGGFPLDTLTDTAAAILLPGLFVVWAGGAVLFFGLSLWRQHVFMQTVKREAVTVSPKLQHVARTVGHQVGLKRLPVIASSFISSGPLVTGLVRPVVLLPAWFETDYDDIQQRAALAHELTHVRRGDLWALQLGELFVACMWFNPLAHIAHRAFRTDQEAACDADVLKTGTASPHAYGATLIKAVKSAAQERLPAAAGLPLTHALKERLSRMTHPVPTRARRVFGGTAAGVLGLAALVATSSVTANASEPETHSVKIEGATVWLNGERIRDRQIVILGDPFEEARISSDTQAEIDRLSAAMSAEGARLSQATATITARAAAHALTPEDSAELNDILKDLGDMPVMDAIPFALDAAFTDTGNMTEEEIEARQRDIEARTEDFDARMEEWGERFGARMEAWGEKVGARAETWSASFEPLVEMKTEEMEARIEAHAAELERLIEDRYGDEFEARMEETGDAIDGLIEECRDTDLADGEVRILTRKISSGAKSREVKMACVKGDRTVLTSARTLSAIDHSRALCDDEKRAFRDHVGEESELDGAND